MALQYYDIPYNLGLIKDVNARVSKEGTIVDGKNFIVKDGIIRRRSGYGQLGQNLPLNGAVMAFAIYDKMLTTEKTLLAFTTRDIYKYNQTNEMWELLTRAYYSGTIEVESVGGVIAGVGVTTSFDTAWSALSVYKIKYGVQAHDTGVTKTGCTWASGATEITVSNNTDLIVGCYITGMSGDGIPEGSIVIGISGTTLTINQTTTAAEASGAAIEFQSPEHTVQSIDASAAITIDPDITLDCSGSSGDDELTVPSIAGLYVGMGVAHADIPDGAYILSLDDSTTITISANMTDDVDGDVGFYQIAPASSKYIIRLCMSGTEDNQISVAMPVDKDSWDRVVVASNGVEMPITWTGTGYFADLAGSPERCKYVCAFDNRTVLAYEYVSGSTRPQTVQFSEVGESDDFSGAIFYDLLKSEDEIIHLEVLQSNMVVYKRKSITDCAPAYNVDDPYSFYEQRVRNVGCIAGKTVSVIGQAHVFLSDSGIMVYDGANARLVEQGCQQELIRNLNKAKMSRSHSFFDEENARYMLHIPSGTNDYPDVTYVYDIAQNLWMYWELAHEMTASGIYYAGKLLTCADALELGWKYADVTGRCVDYLMTSEKPTLVLGDKDGYVYEMNDTYNTDDGEEIEAYFDTRDYPFVDKKHAHLFLELILAIEKQPTGYLDTFLSQDAGSSWSNYIRLDMAGNANVDFIEKIANHMRRGKRTRVRIANVNGSMFAIESIQCGYAFVGTMGQEVS